MLIYNFQKNKMEKVAMPDWLRGVLSVVKRYMKRLAYSLAAGLVLTTLLGKDHHHTKVGLPGVGKLPSTSRLFRTKTIRLPK